MKNSIQPSDSLLFSTAVEDVQPLNYDGIEPYRHKPSPHPRPRPSENPPPAVTARLSETEVTTHDYLLYAQPGIQHRVLAELQRGHLPIALELDLHGLTADYAYATLQAFLADCRVRRLRCVRIIHGKGSRSADQQPVLKRKLNYWLRLHSDVLAFCSAPRHDGGTGALYVLLRNPNKRHQPS
ncbi:Smr/MutS family protein [Thiospirillum jenense]|uniref:Smr/MutS family protein n=1 Tax=Thiospirillum jenense TaxID=1653858 RepID=A0A839HEY4_9GAMM|nr:Smr/MutS family protein [Thiospirillum jenense]MBB1125798.1 Smr/MutS family protein [Thiospirillum jenense]